jgi:hypothetical protein
MNSKKNAYSGPFTNRMKARFKQAITVLSAMALAASMAVLVAPAANAAGTLTNLSWSVTNNQVGATNVTYAYSFKTGSSGQIKTIDFVVSGSGLGGTPTIVKNYGIGAGTPTRVGQTITYTVTGTPPTIPAGIPIYIEFSGLTNSSTAGSYTTAIDDDNSTPAVIDGPTNTGPVTLAANNTAVTVTIAKSATFTIDTTSFTLAMDPSLPALADQSQTVGLSVLTNANSGYTLTVGDQATGLQSGAATSPSIARASVGKANSLAWPGADHFGYTVTATGATADSAFLGPKYAGYVAAGEQVASRANPTGATADTISIINRVAIDYGAPAGDFTDMITYTLTPNYS